MAAACESVFGYAPVQACKVCACGVQPSSLDNRWRYEGQVNRKLIRTTLAEVKGKGRDIAPQKERINNGSPSRSGGGGGDRDGSNQAREQRGAPSSVQVRKRIPPPNETNAEIFYYKKQIDAHTLMVIVLTDGEEIEGTIEWYDRGALKVNRKSAPNLLLLKRSIKYMYKAEDRESGGAAE